ncbi:MAG: methyltransferase domain-containing protein [Anaerolineales bacterium]
MDWHARYTQQARWTAPLRRYLYQKTRLADARRILDVGCGPGVLLTELGQLTPATAHGLDLNRAALKQAAVQAPAAALVCADAHALPYPDASFDITLCHYVLLWLSHPLSALREMRRVTRPGGHVLALAEPDYTRRIDQPPALAPLGRLQTEALTRQGADVGLGARLADLFLQAGIMLIETGELSHGSFAAPGPGEWEMEWAVLRADLAGSLPDADIQKYQQWDAAAWQAGERVLHVPTHFAWGRV